MMKTNRIRERRKVGREVRREVGRKVGRKVKVKVRKRWGGGKVVDMFWHSRV